jgi:Flp pilus assembly pilin Flp
MGIHSRLRRDRKGAGLIEYGILLALLGATSAGMVAAFGQIFLQQMDEIVSQQQNAFAYAATDGVGRLSLTGYNPPNGAVGAAYTFDMATLFTSRGLFEDGETPFWTALDLPDGLTINAATGVVGGTPTNAGTTTATITVDQGDASVQRTYVFTVN